MELPPDRADLDERIGAGQAGDDRHGDRRRRAPVDRGLMLCGAAACVIASLMPWIHGASINCGWTCFGRPSHRLVAFAGSRHLWNLAPTLAVALCGVAVLAVIASVSPRLTVAAATAVLTAGVAAACVVVAVNPPVRDNQRIVIRGIAHPIVGWFGAWVAIAGCALILIGAVLVWTGGRR